MSDIVSLELFLPSHARVSFYLDKDIKEVDDKDKDEDTDLEEIFFEDNKMAKQKKLVHLHLACQGRHPP